MTKECYNNSMKKSFFALLSLVPCAIALAGCNTKQQPQSHYKQIYSMNTYAELVVAGSEMSEEDFESLADRVQTFLTETENSLSATMTGSYIYNFNIADAGATVEIDKTAYDVLSVSKQIYEKTEGYFNPAVWYCEDLYRFIAPHEKMPYDREGFSDGAFTLPDEKYVTAFQQLSTYCDGVALSQLNGKYYATKPVETVKVEGDEREYSLRLDPGGIAKGWCADKVNEMLDEAGVKCGYFNFGTSSMAVKKYAFSDAGDYTISARDPRGAGNYASFKLQNATLSTSGDYLLFRLIDGERYCHIINPYTGAPIRTGIASVTVAGGSAVENDALTTALSAMGKEKAVQYINDNLSDRKVIMLIEDGEGCGIITNCPDDTDVKNSDYKILNTVKNGKIVL